MKTQVMSHRFLPVPWLPLLIALSAALLATTSTPPPAPPPPPPAPSRFEAVLRDELVSRIRALALITEDAHSSSSASADTPASSESDPDGGALPPLTRPFMSDAGTRSRAKLLEFMRASRLHAHIDAVGNVIGDLACPSSTRPASNASATTAQRMAPHNNKNNNNKDRPVLLLGSHFDTVPNAGIWDGLYGLVASIAVARVLAPSVCALPFDIRVVGFDDEEGASPYGVTNFGSKAMSGSLDLRADVRHLDALRARFDQVFPPSSSPASLADQLSKKSKDAGDDDNSATRMVTLEQRVAAARFDASGRRALAFLEVHIEQGPVLEALRRPVGVVTAIAGQTRLSIRWRGAAAHAGTVPMAHRRDALAAAALGVSEVEAVAHGRSVVGVGSGAGSGAGGGGVGGNSKAGGSGGSDNGGLVATVGSLQVYPGAINVVPGEVVMTVDVRAPKDAVRERAVQRIVRRLRDISAARGVGIDVQKVHEVAAVQMSPWVTDVLHNVVSGGGTGGGDTRMMSGAGHDTQFMSRITDVGMLFVRCRGGVSHSPEEFVDHEDAYRGAELLLKAVESIAEREHAAAAAGSGSH